MSLRLENVIYLLKITLASSLLTTHSFTLISYYSCCCNQTLLKAAMSTDCTSSSNSHILSIKSSVETLSSSIVAPIMILNTPKATGSFLNSVFHQSPSMTISSQSFLPSASRSTSGPQGLTSKMTRDLATGGGFFPFLAFEAYSARAALAAAFPPAFPPAAAPPFHPPLAASENLETSANQAKAFGCELGFGALPARDSKLSRSASPGA